MPQSFDSVSRYALQLSLMEIGLGSFLHAFRIPFSGFLLSLNQCFVLNRALQHSTTPFLPMTISNTAAIVKTLSPYGKKFTPMLAISMQGLLFNIGILIFGKNLLGRCVGSLLLSLWPMVQPALIYGIIYGSLVFNMSDYYNQMLAKLPWFSDMTIQALVAGYIFIHMFLSLGICLLTYFLPIRVLDNYNHYMTSYSSSHLKPLSAKTKSTKLQKLLGVWKDFTSPIFLFTLILSGFFFYATLHSLESFFYAYFRLIAIALVTFFLIRNISTEWCIGTFSKLYFLKKCTPYVEEVLLHIQNKIPKR
jgi:hypothetical protein